MKKENWFRQFFCQHSWRKSISYIDIFCDICEKCGKKRDTIQDNLDYTIIKLPQIIILKKK